MLTDAEDQWPFNEYELLQIVPATGYVAVWVVKCKDDESLRELSSYPVDAIGLAKVTSKRFAGKRGEWMREVPGCEAVSNEVVGLLLRDGCWEIVNEDSNYVGMFREVDDLSEATGCLSVDILSKLRITPT